MADKRDAIMDAVAAALGNISVANGYNSEIGTNVFSWRPRIVTEAGVAYTPTLESELPGVHVRDTIDEIAPENQKGDESHSMTVEFEIAHEASSAPDVMRGEINDVRKSLGVDVTLGGLTRRNSFRTMTAETIRIQAEKTFSRTLIRTQVFFSTSAFAES